MQISHWVQLVMNIHHIEQQKDAWFDFCVSCASYIDPLLTIDNGPFFAPNIFLKFTNVTAL